MQVDNINLSETRRLTSPRWLREQHPATVVANAGVVKRRQEIKEILLGTDQRMFVVVGPCSLHDQAVANEYAQRLAALAKQVDDRLLLIMRAHFEKSPRGSNTWTGMLNDPRLDGSFDMVEGVQVTRKTLLGIAELELPIATEFLEPIAPRFVSDLVSLAVVGAHTIESPTHRQMASGLSMPVGFKNGSNGEIDVAINAMQAAQAPHSFLASDDEGKTCIIKTTGNPSGFLVLRGGKSGPNYEQSSLTFAAESLAAVNLNPTIAVDCSHENANRDFRQQGAVWNDVIGQRLAGNSAIRGLLLESNIAAGSQDRDNKTPLEYGVSITDSCIGWEETEALILDAYEKLSAVM
jgi:3-deoxy-7-phosphoheptulonate synthase